MKRLVVFVFFCADRLSNPDTSVDATMAEAPNQDSGRWTDIVEYRIVMIFGNETGLMFTNVAWWLRR